MNSYILDFEDADFLDKPQSHWIDAEFVRWELVKVETGANYEW